MTPVYLSLGRSPTGNGAPPGADRVGLTGSGGHVVKRLVLWAASAVVSCSHPSRRGGIGLGGRCTGSVATVRKAPPAPGPTTVRAALRNVDLDIDETGRATSSRAWSMAPSREVSDTVRRPHRRGRRRGTQYAADWVGIGGASTDDPTLVQTGIQTVVTKTESKSTVTYDAWTESLPKVPKTR